MPVHVKPLHPIDFLVRSAHIYREKTAIVDGGVRRTYPQMLKRVYRFAALLKRLGLQPADRVAVLAPNVAQMLEAHFAVPLAGGVLCTLNIRLMSDEIAYILAHCGASFVLYDGEFESLLADRTTDPKLLRLGDGLLDALDFERELSAAPSGPVAPILTDEDATIAINYTSGTTGRPKGVMFTYRGAYLNAIAEVFHAGLRPESVYLWTVPMFHCNGWCFTWGVVAAGATNICLRKIDYGRILELVGEEGVSHLCAAPTVLVGIANHPAAKRFERTLHVTTAGAPPSPHTILQMEQLGAAVTHVYGLTETYGPFTVCAWKTDWDTYEPDVRAKLKSRQGVPFVTAGIDDLRVVDEAMKDTPSDGLTQGEIVMRGNNVMKGYYDDPEATEKAFRGGYFHSGDVAVMHPDGFIEICDRAKDIIISGGENISTIQVEKVIMEHPAVLECAVVAKPDDKWGEVPKAFVTLKPGATATQDDVIAFCRKHLPGFKTPKAVEFCDLPKTSTGKIQKFVLRDREWAGRDKRVN